MSGSESSVSGGCPPRRLPASALACWIGLLAASFPAVAPAAGPVAPADGPATLETPADLEVGLFAAEPLLSSPSNIDVDARGRVWVCEVVNYRAKQDARPFRMSVTVTRDGDTCKMSDVEFVP